MHCAHLNSQSLFNKTTIEISLLETQIFFSCVGLSNLHEYAMTTHEPSLNIITIWRIYQPEYHHPRDIFSPLALIHSER